MATMLLIYDGIAWATKCPQGHVGDGIMDEIDHLVLQTEIDSNHDKLVDALKFCEAYYAGFKVYAKS